jgi:hypothetical protein
MAYSLGMAMDVVDADAQQSEMVHGVRTLIHGV